MIKKFKTILSIIIIQLMVASFVSADEKEVKDCFEKLNRATFAFNMVLDKVLFRPVAAGYRKLPSPVRTGTSNALNNLSNLITIPNNILQGDLKAAGNNSARFIINTTFGIVGIFDPANALGFEKLEKEDLVKLLAQWELRRMLFSFTSYWPFDCEGCFWIIGFNDRWRCLVQCNCQK